MSTQRFRVVIRDIAAWSTEVTASDSIAAEDAAWALFETNEGREAFERDDDTTVQVEEVPT